MAAAVPSKKHCWSYYYDLFMENTLISLDINPHVGLHGFRVPSWMLVLLFRISEEVVPSSCISLDLRVTPPPTFLNVRMARGCINLRDFGLLILWMDGILHHFETIGNHCSLVFTGEVYHSRWCEMVFATHGINVFRVKK